MHPAGVGAVKRVHNQSCRPALHVATATPDSVRACPAHAYAAPAAIILAASPLAPTFMTLMEGFHLVHMSSSRVTHTMCCWIMH